MPVCYATIITVPVYKITEVGTTKTGYPDNCCEKYLVSWPRGSAPDFYAGCWVFKSQYCLFYGVS